MNQVQTTGQTSGDARRANSATGAVTRRRRSGRATARGVLLLAAAAAVVVAGRPAPMVAQPAPPVRGADPYDPAVRPTPPAGQPSGAQLVGAPRGPVPAVPTSIPADALQSRNPAVIIPPRGRASAGPTTQISLNLKDASIDAVLEYLSKSAGFIIVKDAPVDGKITMISAQPVSPDQAVSLLNTVLKGNGYTAIRMGRTLKITSLSRALTSNIPVLYTSKPEDLDETDDLVTVIIPVQNIDAVRLKTDLAPLVGTDGAFTANAGSNSLVVTNTMANARRVVDIVNRLDAKDALQNDIRVRQLKFADAAATAKLITDVFAPPASAGNGQQQQNRQFGRFGGGQGGGGFGGFGGGGGGFGGGGGGGQQGGQADEKGKTGTVTASSDARTNTIVVTGPRETLDLIEKTILDKIDNDPAADTAFFSYHVKNGQAVDIQNTINTMFGASISGTSSRSGSSNASRIGSSSGGFGSSSGAFGSSTNGFGGSGGSGGFGSSSGGFGSSSGGTGRTGSNTSSSRTGGGGQSTPARAGGSSSGTLSGGLAGLQGQVQAVADVDTNTLLVITATKYQQAVKDLITDLDRPVPQVLIKVLVAEVTHDRADDIGTDFSVLNLRASGRGQDLATSLGNSASALTSGGLAVSVLESNLAATFHALASANKLDVLSRPYILTSDNQEASILVGQRVPIINNTRVTDAGQQINTVNYENIGISLDVVPHINADGLVVMDVNPSISSISDSSVQIQAGVFSPIFNQRSATSHVGVRDGETIVIGGLMQDTKTQTITKIPVVGDIPYLGLLFQRDNVTKTKTELLFFLTPHVALDPEKLPGFAADELRGVKLTPNAVQDGTFKEQIDGLRRGGSTTQPALPVPTVPKDRDSWEPEPRMP